MRRLLLHRTIIGAAAVTLLAGSVVVAQSESQPAINTAIPPDPIGDTLTTYVLRNALDREGTNSRIADEVRAYHISLGGLDDKPKKKKGGIVVDDPAADTSALTDELIGALQEKPRLVVVSGGDGQQDASLADLVEDSTVIDLGQAPPCLSANGQADPTGECAGALPSNYTAVDFAVEDAAFLAGVVAARLSRTSLGIVGGYEGCVECQRYIEGFINGARSAEPDIPIDIAFVADNEVDGFGDPQNSRTFTEAFIDIYQPDVILPVGRGSTVSMIEAVCDADATIWAVGAGFDVLAERPDLDCVMASIVPDLSRAITETMFLFANGETMRVMRYDLANEGVELTDEWRRNSRVPTDTSEFYEAADAGLRSGQIKACPDGCGSPTGDGGA